MDSSNLDKVQEKTPNTTPSFNLKYFPQSDILANSLSQMFPEQAHEDKKLQRAKEILGDKYTAEEAKELIASFEYLTNNWLEEYEKKVFNGKTLRELLQDL